MAIRFPMMPGETHSRRMNMPLARICIVVGHSLGAAFLLSILGDFEAKAAFFIAPACGKTNNEFAPAMASIVDRPFSGIRSERIAKSFIFSMRTTIRIFRWKERRLCRVISSVMSWLSPAPGTSMLLRGMKSFRFWRRFSAHLNECKTHNA